MILSGMQGFGAATPATRRTIVIDTPLVIEGKIPKDAQAPAPGGKKTQIPWKWIGLGGGLLALFLIARASKKKGRRGPLGVAG